MSCNMSPKLILPLQVEIFHNCTLVIRNKLHISAAFTKTVIYSSFFLTNMVRQVFRANILFCLCQAIFKSYLVTCLNVAILWLQGCCLSVTTALPFLHTARKLMDKRSWKD